jgi:Tfp pilus assembly protein PilN
VAQIGVIRTVDGDRYVWPHLLDEVTKALPPYTWLVDMGYAAPAAPPAPAAGAAPAAAQTDTMPAAPVASPLVSFNVNGRTVDIQAYTRFLRQLEASPWITDVTPVSAQTVIENERPVTAFTIRATYRQADSAYIRTVPLSESVR